MPISRGRSAQQLTRPAKIDQTGQPLTTASYAGVWPGSGRQPPADHLREGSRCRRRGHRFRPPTLRTGEEATASRLELFFDLAYVLVVLELANAFYSDLSWRGLAVFVALYVALWFSWVGFTLYANRFDTDDVVFRIAKLAATASIAGCAASASAATGASPPRSRCASWPAA